MNKTIPFAVVLLLFAGCASKSREPSAEARPKLQLTEIHRMIKTYDTAKKAFPSRFEDLRRSESNFPLALHALRSGECVLVWSATSAIAEEAVLAYAKTAPNEGGLVVLKNGNVKKMTAEQLKSVLPAKR